MTEQNKDVSNGANLDADAARLEAEAIVAQAAKAHAEAGEAPGETSPDASDGHAPREIVLQRLSAQSSWEQGDFRHGFERQESFDGPFEHAMPPVGGALRERRTLLLLAVIAIAATVGAIGGSLATAGVGRLVSGHESDIASALAADQSRNLDAALAKLNTDVAALKTATSAQAAKIVGRVDSLEKAQAEPAAKLAKLTEAVDKLRAAEATGSIAQPAAAAAAPAAVANRMPIVDGWVLRQVSDGMATVEGRQGVFGVLPGDPLPGVGTVDAIRKQDGRWVVVTRKGLIVSR